MPKYLYKVVMVNRKKEYKSCSIDGRSKFCITYKIGDIVEAEDTLGIFCFDKLFNAKSWYEAYANRLFDNSKYKILRVIPLDKVNKNIKAISFVDFINFFYSKIFKDGSISDDNDSCLLTNIILGTVTCKKIKVISEVTLKTK